MNDFRIVFMGTPDFAAAILKKLIDTGRNVVGVFSQPDKPQGRKQTLLPTPVKALAEENGIPLFQPVKLRDGSALEIMRELAPDIVVVAAYGRMLPVDLLEVPRLGCVNVHGSLLPKYRGAAPIQWSVINGEAETGITTMYMAEGMDTGDVIERFSLPIGPDETSGELFCRMAELGAAAIESTLALFDSGAVPREKQDEGGASTAPMLKKEMGDIDFTKSALEIHNLARGMDPWPTAYTYYEGKVLKVRLAKAAQGYSGEPGELLDAKKLIIGCGGGAVELLRVQPEGKGDMDGSAFICGRRIGKGARFGGALEEGN